MKKKMMKRVVSFALAMMMAITAIMVGGAEEAKADETVQEIALTDAGFDAFWDNWSYSINDANSDGSWPGTNDAKDGTVSIWREDAAEIYIYAKNAVSLEAGTYRMSISAKSTGDVGVKFAFDSSNKSEKVVMSSESGSAYATYSAELTLNSASSLWIGFDILCGDGGWTQIDSIKLEKIPALSEPEPVYTIEATTEKTSVEEDGTVKITAVVKKDGIVVPQDELDDEDLQVWFWADQWKAGHENGLVDATFANYDNNSGYSLTADITLPSAGTYYIMAELRETAPSETEKGAWVAEKCVTLTATAASSDGGQGAGSEPQPETTPEPEVKEEEKPVVIELDNSNFSTATDGTWTGEIAKGEWKDGNDMQVLSYSSDSCLELPSYVGTTGLKFNMEQGNTMTISQWVDSLKAGTYTITAPVMGENTDVYLVLGDKEIKATSLSGYNSWTKAKATFTIKEDMTDVKVGFKLVATSSGENSWSWGWIDSIQLIKTVPGTGDTSNIYAYVMLMMAGIALVGYSVKRNKVQF